MNLRLIAIGDIHGCFNSLQILLENKIQIKKDDKVIFLGDYIDRGNQSKEVLDYVINLKVNGFDIVPLRGNHETMLLDAYENSGLLSKWIQNGGSETLKSFNISNLKDLDSKYIDFFKSLPYYFAFGKYLFVHAGFNDSCIDPFSDYYSMIWTCKKSYENTEFLDKIIIHGHRPIPIDVCKTLVNSGGKVVNLDTGCVYVDKTGFGTLTAYELITRSLYFA